MNSLIPILADEGDVIAKIVIGVVVLIFWGIGSLASVFKNRSIRTAPWETVEEEATELGPQMEVARTRPAPVRPPVTRTPVARPPALRPGARLIAMPPRPAPRSVAPATGVQPAPKQRLAPPPLTPAAPPAKPASPQAVPTSLAAARSAPSPWAQKLRPESLRSQWILTEILAKPVALRDIDEGRA